MWLCAVTLMLVIYAILDGFDLGAGIPHLLLGRTEHDRRAIRTAIGPFWDGNEVWLLLASIALYGGYPAIYTSRAFYAAGIALIWLLILRGLSLESRNPVRHSRWLDIVFSVSSILLTLSLGIAVGYWIRSVPPVAGSAIGDWFPPLCGLCALAVLTLQSSAWLAVKTTGELQVRCRRLASRVWWAVMVCYVAVTTTALIAQPHILANLLAHSRISVFICAFAVTTLAGLIGARLCLSVDFDLGTFAGASCVIAGLLTSASAGQFPLVHNAISGPQTLSISALWWLPAFVLATGYNLHVHRLSAGKLAGRTGLANVYAHR
jgi:cytochrome d ubiquinol oxidase subunit II